MIYVNDDIVSSLSCAGGTGPTTDQGWGCMLRCGQMMLAQALVYKHLGRGMKGIQYSIMGVLELVDEMHLKNGC